MTIYGVDVASYQGNVDWASVERSGINFGFSKVSESTSYTNPTWQHNKAGMLARGDDFLPGAYHFLVKGNGAAQARFFLSRFGTGVDKFAVALDVEAKGADIATSRAWVAEFKRLTNNHPVLGYYPRWYWEETGRGDLTFFDGLWQSRYVSGSGSPASLFGKVSDSWWSSFGNEAVRILQFSSSGKVNGISGACDVNAFRGTLAQLKQLALGVEEDVPLTQDEINKIAEAVWKRDGMIDAPPDKVAEGNAFWTAGSYEYWGYRQLTAVLDMVRQIAGRPEVDVDENAIAQAVIGALSPQAIADAVVAKMPSDLAKQTADEIAARLQS